MGPPSLGHQAGTHGLQNFVNQFLGRHLTFANSLILLLPIPLPEVVLLFYYKTRTIVSSVRSSFFLKITVTT